MKAFWLLALTAACGAPGALEADMVPVTAPSPTLMTHAATAGTLLYLHWSEGSPVSPNVADACPWAPPVSTMPVEIRAAVLAQLNAWYADFDATWLEGSPSGARYEVVVSDGAGTWCNGLPLSAGGAAPFDCRKLPGATSHVFAHGNDAQDVHALATAIAQEQAHQLGLEHTLNNFDVMNPFLSASATGFGRLSAISAPNCNKATQDSYSMMRAALGPSKGIAP